MAFNTAAFATNIDTEEWCDRLIEADPFSRYSPVSSDIRKARYLQLGKDLQTSLNDVKTWVSGLPQTIQFGVVYTYAKAAQYYLDNTEHRHAVWAVGSVFATVWMAWKIRRLQPFMTRRFLHDPLSGRVSTMLTSVFSHQGIVHLGFNTMALAGFGASTMVYMQQSQEHNEMGMPESTQAYHFIAFFIAAGLFSSLASQIVSARFKYPRLIARLSREASTSLHTPRTFSFAEALSRPAETASASAKQAAADRSSAILPSLGGSGAIYACVTLTALAFPDAVVSLIFPPTSPIPIQVGVGGLVLLDIVGALRGWRLFDHWAHLGGAVFGALYFRYGPKFWDWMRSLDAEMVTVDEDGTVIDVGQIEFVEDSQKGSGEDQRS